MKISFIGPRDGVEITPAQGRCLQDWLERLLLLEGATELHFGDRESEQALVGEAELMGVKTFSYPPVEEAAGWPADVRAEPLPGQGRDHAVVDAGDLLLAAPHIPECIWDKMWMAIRRARKANKSVITCWPDGTFSDEREDLAIREVKLGGNVRKMVYRPGTSDYKTMVDILDRGMYRDRPMRFEPQSGEHWLDLGANIGSFSMFCELRGASVECWEPEPGNFEILKLNAPDSTLVRSAITNLLDAEISFAGSGKTGEFTRGTAFPRDSRKLAKLDPVPNVHASALLGRKFDGMKMDIEGSEFGILDEGLLPEVQQLCFEYHTSVDPSVENLIRRVEGLRAIFKEVKVPSPLRNMMNGARVPPVDYVIFCSNV